MLLGLDAGVGQMVDLDLKPCLFPDRLYHLRELQDGELLCELVEYAKFARLGRIEAGDLDTAHGVANVQESARLSSFSINRERVPKSGLRAETIQHGAKYFVVVEAVDESFVKRRFIGHGSIDNALIKIGSADSPRLAGECDVVAVMHLR